MSVWPSWQVLQLRTVKFRVRLSGDIIFKLRLQDVECGCHEQQEVNEKRPKPRNSPSHNHDSTAPRPHPLICTGAGPIHPVHGPLWLPATEAMPRKDSHFCHFGGLFGHWWARMQTGKEKWSLMWFSVSKGISESQVCPCLCPKCFYYCSERNNAVVLFGTLKVQSIILTEVSH